MSQSDATKPDANRNAEPSAGGGDRAGDRQDGAAMERELSPEARRALAEAEERRKLAHNGTASGADSPREVGGRKGPEPTRFGDWEKGGIVSDF